MAWNKKGGGYDRSLYKTPIYRSWFNMKTRCYNEGVRSYKDYGGRGITVCEKWLGFKGFYEDMASTWGAGLQIDRIDNNGDYNKENCRWSTPKEQANNRRTNTFLTLNGETKTFAEWCAESKAKPSTIRQRFYSYGWSLEQALFT